MLRTADKRLFMGKQLCCDVFDPTYPTFVDPRGVLSVTSWGPWSGAFSISPGTNVSATAWPANNRAIFVPVVIPFAAVAEKIVVGCGAVAGNNFDVGIYDPSGKRLVSSGSTARAASSEVVVDIADTYLRAGSYFLGMSLDVVSNMFMKNPANLAFARLAGVRTMETAFVLPDPAVFATAASAQIPSINVLLRPSFSTASISPVRLSPLPAINPFGMDSLGILMAGANISTQMNATASRIPGANFVSYVPFRINAHATVRKMSLLVGATNTGNVQVGIYTAGGTRIATSGTVALGTANTLQEFDIADTLLAPGTYFMAATLSNAAGTWFGPSQADELALSNWPLFQETTGGFGLPDTATMVLSTTATPLYPPVMGVHFDTLI